LLTSHRGRPRPPEIERLGGVQLQFHALEARLFLFDLRRFHREIRHGFALVEADGTAAPGGALHGFGYKRGGELRERGERKFDVRVAFGLRKVVHRFRELRGRFQGDGALAGGDLRRGDVGQSIGENAWTCTESTLALSIAMSCSRPDMSPRQVRGRSGSPLKTVLNQ